MKYFKIFAFVMFAILSMAASKFNEGDSHLRLARGIPGQHHRHGYGYSGGFRELNGQPRIMKHAT
ncbi:hypothetical protein HW555_000194 [Spodoptera exigua]|uniref:Uncharacterized protein n=1 Tax=Spodoptera exigua TaxID=7107 RepID=A0A835GVE0_SPOEX|nr:hypothetical protein HW555_000194 [Spodoptera exigua]